MKKNIKKISSLLLLIVLSLQILVASELNNKLKISTEGPLVIRPSTVSIGVVKPSFNISNVEDVNITSSNGLTIGVSAISPLLYRGDQSDPTITYLLEEVRVRYVQRNFKEIENDSEKKIVSRDFLEYASLLRYDVLGWELIYPYIGFSLSWLLATNGPSPNHTWINDIHLLFGIQLSGFSYEYSHGTFTSMISNEHKSKTHTHTFSLSVSF